MADSKPERVFYGWWIVLAAFLNLFFAVGIVFYGLPRFYASLIDSLQFSREQVASGIFYGFVVVAPAFGLLAGALIDRLGAKLSILLGISLVGPSLFLLGSITSLRQYYVLCFTEVTGYVLAGPIPNQVLIANWFRLLRGRSMGYAYLGLGLGGALSPSLIDHLIASLGWRRSFESIGVAIMVVLLPVGIFVTRSTPRDLGLEPDGDLPGPAAEPAKTGNSLSVRQAAGTRNFWLLLAGSTLVIGAIGTVIFHFILFLKDDGYSSRSASHTLTVLLCSSLVGRVVVGHFADRFTRKNVMALFYFTLALAIPLLFLHHHSRALLGFAVLFGFAMGADYMLIPLVAADCFGLTSLGKILALVIMADSLGQSFGPVMAGRIFDRRHSYDLAWIIITIAGVVGAGLIYLISSKKERLA